MAGREVRGREAPEPAGLGFPAFLRVSTGTWACQPRLLRWLLWVRCGGPGDIENPSQGSDTPCPARRPGTGSRNGRIRSLKGTP